MTTTSDTTSNAAGTVEQLELARIAPHPDNPRSAWGDMDGLQASLRARGLIQPIIVVPVAAFLEARSDTDTGSLGEAQYVVYAGHRRRAAALGLGWSTIPALIRPDMATSAAATFVSENLHREDLTPLDEAAAYATLRDDGLSQRQIATECGVSQSHVSKRLNLLRMPQGAQDALAAGRITIADAGKLGTLSGDAQVDAWELVVFQRYGVDNAVYTIERRIADRKAIEKARRQADHEGVDLVDDPQKVFGRGYWDHRLYDKKDVEKARKAGTLRAAVTPRGLDYFTTDAPKKRRSQDDDQAARKRAAKARGAALAQMVAKPPAAKQLGAELAAAIVHGRTGHTDALNLVRKWLLNQFPQPDKKPGSYQTEYDAWRDALLEADWPWIAWAMTIAATEIDAKSQWKVWGPREAAHVRRLVDAVGYEPTEWETEQLARIDRAVTEAAEGDSARITDGPDHAGADNAYDPDDPDYNWIDDDVDVDQGVAS
ncbi:MAG TPA: ParB/RepB/Spo0J family partition protein [Kribbellaceae bacterium]